jgi:hypothetical protein
MPPRPIDYIGAALLSVILIGLVAVLFISNIPAAAS